MWLVFLDLFLSAIYPLVKHLRNMSVYILKKSPTPLSGTPVATAIPITYKVRVLNSMQKLLFLER